MIAFCLFISIEGTFRNGLTKVEKFIIRLTMRIIFSSFFQLPKTIVLQAGVIVVVQVVDAYYGATVHLREQPVHQIAPDESSVACNQYGFVI